jgi:hypothetical protein
MQIKLFMKKSLLTILTSFLLLILIVSCKKNISNESNQEALVANHPGFGNGNLPLIAAQRTSDILFTNASGYHVYNGGYGSGIAVKPGPGQNHLFYYLTDRGPNVAGFGGLYFIVPDFNPQIGVFKLEGDSLRRVRVINLKNPAGQLITGLPNPANQNPTGEVAYDANGHVLAYDPYGMDTEGLAAMTDGSFWISDEYGPHIAHFDANGNQLERISPFQNGTNNREIPKVFIRRRANRGMEGLAATPDGKWLLGGMQGPLDNPGSPTVTRNKARDSRANRLLFFNIETGATKQYIYRTEIAGNYISDIVAVSNTEFLVLERDGNFPLAGNPSSSFKRVYRINISGASDVSDPTNSATGILINNKTLEVAAFDNEPGFASLKPVSKSLAINIIAAFPDFPHDKTEGIALIGNDLLAISNDDDFGVVDDGAGGYIPKYLPFFNPAQVIDHGVTYFVKIPSTNN